VEASHRPGCLHPAAAGVPDQDRRVPWAGGGEEKDTAGAAYLLGAGVLYQRWAAATAPHHLPQNTGRRRHPDGGGALHNPPWINSPATLTQVLCSERGSLSFGISLGDFR